MNLQDFLRGRRSIRHFSPTAIPMGIIHQILATAASAPSAHNRQPWRFAVVTSAAGKSALADEMAKEYRRDLVRDGLPQAEVNAAVERSKLRINSAPVAIVLCMDMSEMDTYNDPRRDSAERAMAIQSTANAGATLLLAAHAEGLGGVWSCAPLFAPRAVASALDLPPSWEAQALLLIGRPAETPRARPRKPLEALAIFR